MKHKSLKKPVVDQRTGPIFHLGPLVGNKIRIGVLADAHCGHMLGLTPSDGWKPLEAEDPGIQLLARRQREYWDTYNHLLKEAGPVDHLLVNGDMIDGDGFRLQGAETVSQSHDEMATWASMVIKKWITPGVTKTVHMIGGTPSHTWFGPIDVEKLVRDNVITKTPNVTYDQAALVRFSFQGTDRTFTIQQRHDTPKGSVQAGGAGPGAIRQSVKLDLESFYNGGSPLADLYLFSHAHEAAYCEIPLYGRTKHVVVTPCLQGGGSVYGKTKCAGIISWGITVLELELVRGEIRFSKTFLTRSLHANRQTVIDVAYGIKH